MVRALRGDGVSHAHALDGPGIVGGHSLVLGHGHTQTAENLAGDPSARAEYPSERRSLSDLAHEAQRGFPVPEGGQPRVHGHADGRSGFDGVVPEIVAHTVQQGDGVQIVDAKVGPEQAEVLVFDG